MRYYDYRLMSTFKVSVNLHTELGPTQSLDVIFNICQELPIGKTSNLSKNFHFHWLFGLLGKGKI